MLTPPFDPADCTMVSSSLLSPSQLSPLFHDFHLYLRRLLPAPHWAFLSTSLLTYSPSRRTLSPPYTTGGHRIQQCHPSYARCRERFDAFTARCACPSYARCISEMLLVRFVQHIASLSLPFPDTEADSPFPIFSSLLQSLRSVLQRALAARKWVETCSTALRSSN